MSKRRPTLVPLILSLLLSACGSSGMSLDEYAQWFTDLTDEANERATTGIGPQGGVLFATGEQLAAFTPGDLHTSLKQVGEIEAWVLGEAAKVDPPDGAAGLHDYFFSDTYTAAREGLAARAATTDDWQELSDSAEMAAYRDAVAGDRQTCLDMQAMIDGTAVAESLSETVFIPRQMQEVVEAALGCERFPADPQAMLRP